MKRLSQIGSKAYSGAKMGDHMHKFYRRSRTSIVIAALAVLAGCSAVGVNGVSIEDKSIGSENTPQLVVTQPEGVEVTAVTLQPTFNANDTPDVAIARASDQPKAVEVATTAQKPATIALLNTASYQRDSGKLRAAQTSLERALRISPKDPEVYYSLGEIHRRLGEYIQAEQMVLKGIAVASGQSKKLKRFWGALAKIRAESGDKNGAKIALRKSQSY